MLIERTSFYINNDYARATIKIIGLKMTNAIYVLIDKFNYIIM